jgi:hypothetical protein
MKEIAYVTMVLVVLLPSILGQAQDAPVLSNESSQRMLHRYRVIVTDDACLKVAQEGSYIVNKGDLIEIDYLFNWWPPCPLYESTCTTTDKKVVKIHSLGDFPIVDDYIGSPTTHGFFFKAVGKGDCTIILKINEQSFRYNIHVF